MCFPVLCLCIFVIVDTFQQVEFRSVIVTENLRESSQCVSSILGH